MPFCDDLDWLRDEVVKAGRDANVTVQRADDISLPGVVLDQVLEAIRQADVVIAVCTGRNANVFFELGYAWHTHNSVLVASSDEDLPFDVSHLRTEFYGKPGSGQDRSTIRQRLSRAIKAAADNHTPVVPKLDMHPQVAIDERMVFLKESVHTKMRASPLPIAYLAIVALTKFDHLFQPDGPTIKEIRNLSPAPVFGIEETGSVILPYIRPEFKGVTLTESNNGHAGYDWMSFYNDGSFVGVITGHPSLQHGILDLQRGRNDGYRHENGFYDHVLTVQVAARLRAFGLLANLLNAHGDVTIRVGIADISLPAAVATGRFRTGVHHSRVVESPIDTGLTVNIANDLTTIGGVLRTTAGLLNDLMTAFQWRRCFQLEPDGAVVLSTWGRRWRSNVKHWVNENNLPAVDDYED